MNNFVIITSSIILILSLIACNPNKSNGETPSTSQETVKEAITTDVFLSKTSTFSNELMSFEYPANWKIDIMPVDQVLTNYNLHVFDKDDNFLFTYLFTIDQPANNYMLTQNKEGLETSFNPSNQNSIKSLMTKTSTGEEVFYYEFKNNDMYSVALFFPVGAAQAPFSVIGGVQIKEDAYQYIKSGIIKQVAESIKIKLK